MLNKEPYDPAAPPSRQFRGPVHGVAVSTDGFVYVTDRMGNRVQVFRKDGGFVAEVLIRPETRSLGTAWDVALSRDPDQKWLAVSDGSNHVVWLLDRKTLKIVGILRLGWTQCGSVRVGPQPGHRFEGQCLHRGGRDRKARAEVHPRAR